MLASQEQIRWAIHAEQAAEPELAIMLSPAADAFLEEMAQRVQMLTRRHFGRTISLFAPLYLSNFCRNGCAYCGFATDRKIHRRRLELDDVRRELQAMKGMGIEEVLLLTGERTPEADFDYLLACVRAAAEIVSLVTVETFPMESAEYAALAAAGCTGLTMFQETYDRQRYDELHRWGPKKNYEYRRAAPQRALAAGLRTAGLGALLGLTDPMSDALELYRHVIDIQRTCWRSGLSISFPRMRPQAGGFQAPFWVDDRWLARLIFALRICLPEVPLVLSTRESPAFRDGMAGLGINKMSVASRTTVGGYGADAGAEPGQFEVSDDRDVSEFCAMLRAKGLEPVFKNWDAVYR